MTPPTGPMPLHIKAHGGADCRAPLGKVAVWLAMLLLLATTGATTACGLFDSVKVAEAEVEAFHSRYNDGRHREIYLQADAMLQQTASEADFVKLVEAIHRKLGNLEHATQDGFNVTWEVGSKWVTLSYQSQFTHGEGVEEFVWHVDGGTAKLVGYNINSPELILR